MSVYKSSPVGNLIQCEIFGIDNVGLLNDGCGIDDVVRDALLSDKFTILGRSSKCFVPGYSLVFLLAESHLAVHTYPEYKSMSLTFYTCRKPNDGWAVVDSILRSVPHVEVYTFEVPVVVSRE